MNLLQPEKICFASKRNRRHVALSDFKFDSDGIYRMGTAARYVVGIENSISFPVIQNVKEYFTQQFCGKHFVFEKKK